MNDIKLKDINNSSHHYILNNLEIIQKHLNDIVTNSDQKLVENLIEETKIILEQCCDESITYQQRAELFNNLSLYWLDLWKHYNHLPEAIELGYKIDDLTNSFVSYHQLFLGISIVNDEKVGDEEIDSHKVVKGYQLMAETIDVFVNLLPILVLTQLYENAQKTLLKTSYDFKGYFKDSREKIGLVTQLRGYCSLIILRIDQYLSEKELSSKQTEKVNSSSSLWWENISGTFADDSLYDEAMKLGKEYRNSTVIN